MDNFIEEAIMSRHFDKCINYLDVGEGGDCQYQHMSIITLYIVRLEGKK
ncbi:hypothetical protein RJG79_11720 [Mycoplasmatota bacterium WC44]